MTVRRDTSETEKALLHVCAALMTRAGKTELRISAEEGTTLTGTSITVMTDPQGAITVTLETERHAQA